MRSASCKGFLAGLIVLLLSLPVHATGITPGTAWTEPVFSRLDVGFAGGEFHARWEFYRCACGDVLIRAEETLPEGLRTGELLLIGGRVLLVKGFANADAGPALLDSPMLMLQLLLVLLQKAEPAGPSAIALPVTVDAAEENDPIRLDTGTAHGGFPAPWRVGGELRPAGEGSRHFKLDFEFGAGLRSRPDPNSSVWLSGVMDFGARDFPLGGDAAVDDWSLFTIHPDDDDLLAGRSFDSLAALRDLVRSLQK